jgi:ribonuclease R
MKGHSAFPVEFRELMAEFGVSKAERSLFKEIVDEMVAAGILVRHPGRLFTLALTSASPGQGAIIGKLATHRDGYGFVTPEGGGEDIFIPARYLRENMHGDLVEVQVVINKRGGKREGRIARTVERGFTSIAGRFELYGKVGRVIPDEYRLNKEVWIHPDNWGGAMDGDIVVAEITSWPTAVKGLSGKIVEVLGKRDDPDVEVQLIIRKYDLPYLFPPQTMAEARAVPLQVTDADLTGRIDLRARLTVTIDGEAARDFDDAVSVRREANGAIRLWVSIADVSHYVKPGSPLDQEAYLRGTSVYFPDRCIPMLPEELSNGICSLNPQVDRLTMTAELLVDRDGEILQSTFYPSVIKSTARLTYTVVRKVLVDRDPEAIEAHGPLLEDLAVMEELALRLTEKRRQRGSIDLDLPEPQIVLDLQGHTENIIRAERNLAHRIIEEFMLAANEAVSSHIESTGVPSLYRVHESPDLVKLQDFSELVHGLGYELRLSGDQLHPSEFQRLLVEVEGKPEERMINEVLLRCMKQARYSAENLGHFGLAAKTYTHFTSPIRRYPDLVVHRILRKVLSGKVKERERDLLAETLPETALHTSKRERVAMEAEREIVELKKMQFMQDKVGEEFDGIISGVAWFGFFVDLTELFVEGLVPVTSLQGDNYGFQEKQHALIGERTRMQYRLGDRVRIRVAAVSMERKQVEFVLAGTGVSAFFRGSAGGEEYLRVPVRGKRPGKGKSADRNDSSGNKGATGKESRRKGAPSKGRKGPARKKR